MRDFSTGALTDSAAPVAEWETVASYDTANDCSAGKVEAARENREAYDNPGSQPQPKDMKGPPEVWRSWVKVNAERALEAVCIATDDPRLKEK